MSNITFEQKMTLLEMAIKWCDISRASSSEIKNPIEVYKEFVSALSDGATPTPSFDSNFEQKVTEKMDEFYEKAYDVASNMKTVLGEVAVEMKTDLENVATGMKTSLQDIINSVRCLKKSVDKTDNEE